MSRKSDDEKLGLNISRAELEGHEQAHEHLRGMPVVSSVYAGHAAEGYLLVGDVITSIDGKSVYTLAQFHQLLGVAGTSVVFCVLRASTQSEP